ncbi:hypothetical protein EV662_1068 [Rhodovulum marinum]|uniref:Universal stress protein family protein n=2 Tax=Rhodovulum marinum TaxID=320662 RepID=A0A4R2Q2D5_9RHOB|nr:hypothetical protein EV662_1068 [Rhodovulum marinum]
MRVILSASCFSDAKAMLALATGLAAEAGAILEGVLVEEAGLALATFGAARFVDTAGRTIALPGPERMGAAYARDAARFERLLTDTAAKSALRWSFRRASGRSTEILAALAVPGDLLVLPASPFHAPLRELVLDSGADKGLGPLARATATRLGRPLRDLSAAQPGTVTPPPAAGSVLFSMLPPGGLAVLDSAPRCARVLCIRSLG